MSDEHQNSNPDQSGPVGSEGTITYGVNERGDLVIDGTVVEKNPHGFGPENSQAPAASPEDVEALRRERDELRENFEKVDHFMPLFSKPQFREWVQEQVAMGEFEPPRSPAPEPEHIIGYRERISEPESASILAAMREYVVTLPTYQAEELDNNHRTFCAVYDRFKQAGAGKLPRPAMPAAYPQVPMDRRTLEAVIRSKEVRNARVEPPGGALPDYPARDEGQDAAKSYATAKARLQRAREGSTPVDINRLENEMIQAYFGDEPKTPRRSRGPEY